MPTTTTGSRDQLRCRQRHRLRRSRPGPEADPVRADPVRGEMTFCTTWVQNVQPGVGRSAISSRSTRATCPRSNCPRHRPGSPRARRRTCRARRRSRSHSGRAQKLTGCVSPGSSVTRSNPRSLVKTQRTPGELQSIQTGLAQRGRMVRSRARGRPAGRSLPGSAQQIPAGPLPAPTRAPRAYASGVR